MSPTQVQPVLPTHVHAGGTVTQSQVQTAPAGMGSPQVSVYVLPSSSYSIEVVPGDELPGVPGGTDGEGEGEVDGS